MSDTDDMGFGKFVPGFDFLQNLAKGATQSMPQIPNLANWVSPSLNVEEIEKRIGELRAVHFWLEQNTRALAATIQALEVQKMTLATLKGMNFNLGEVANAFKPKVADPVAAAVEKTAERGSAGSSSVAEVAPDAASVADDAARRVQAGKTKAKAKSSAAAASLVDPLNLWGSLTQQFQQIAASAMQEATRSSLANTGRSSASDAARQGPKAGKKTAPARTRKLAASKAGSRKKAR